MSPTKHFIYTSFLLQMKQNFCRCVAESRILGKFLGYCIFSPYDDDVDVNSAELVANQISHRKSVRIDYLHAFCCTSILVCIYSVYFAHFRRAFVEGILKSLIKIP